MDPLNREYLDDLRMHCEHVKDHTNGVDDELWGPGELPYSVLPPFGIWSPSEKRLFFAALSRHSRLRPDLVAESIQTKTFPEVCVYMEALEEKRMGVELGILGFPTPVEVSDTIEDLESRQSDILTSLEIESGRIGESAYGIQSIPKEDQRPNKRQRIELDSENENMDSTASDITGALDYTHDPSAMVNLQSVMSLLSRLRPSVLANESSCEPQTPASSVVHALGSLLETWLRTVLSQLNLLTESQQRDNKGGTAEVSRIHVSRTLATLQRRHPRTYVDTMDGQCASQSNSFAGDESVALGRSDEESGESSPPSFHLAWHPTLLQTVDATVQDDEIIFEDDLLEGTDAWDSESDHGDSTVEHRDQQRDIEECRRLSKRYGLLPRKEADSSFGKSYQDPISKKSKRKKTVFKFTEEQLATLVSFRSRSPHPLWEDIVALAKEIASDELLIYNWFLVQTLTNRATGVKRPSPKYTPDQLSVLESLYQSNNKPTIEEQAQAAVQTGLSPSQVYFWQVSEPDYSESSPHPAIEKPGPQLKKTQGVTYTAAPNPDEQTRIKLADQLGLTVDQVNYWFGKRASAKIQRGNYAAPVSTSLSTANEDAVSCGEDDLEDFGEQ
ncbi:hypothetical protein FRB90_001205 [Tulasnella sp. 427]|nr:hypothetical protein FRB90_001205 [Tulasnella sp. 427]